MGDLLKIYTCKIETRNPIGLKFSISPDFEVTTPCIHINMRTQEKMLKAITNKNNRL